MALLPPSVTIPIVWEEAPTGPHQGTVWLYKPAIIIGLLLYFDTDPNGFHFGSAIKYWSDDDRQAFHRKLFGHLVHRHPRIWVP